MQFEPFWSPLITQGVQKKQLLNCINLAVVTHDKRTHNASAFFFVLTLQKSLKYLSLTFFTFSMVAQKTREPHFGGFGGEIYGQTF